MISTAQPIQFRLAGGHSTLLCRSRFNNRLGEVFQTVFFGETERNHEGAVEPRVNAGLNRFPVELQGNVRDRVPYRAEDLHPSEGADAVDGSLANAAAHEITIRVNRPPFGACFADVAAEKVVACLDVDGDDLPEMPRLKLSFQLIVVNPVGQPDVSTCFELHTASIALYTPQARAGREPSVSGQIGRLWCNPRGPEGLS